MLQQIKNFFQLNLEPRLSEEDLNKQLRLAACALMLEVARMDQHLDEDELRAIANACQSLYQLDSAEVEELMVLARTESREATSLYQFTSLIHSHYDEQQKFNLIRLMWDVALADGKVAAIEEHLIRRVADLLYVPRERFTQARHLAEEARKD